MKSSLMAVVGLGVLTLVGAAYGDYVRFHVGTFQGQWCDGNPVTYRVTSALGPNAWGGRIQNGTTLDRLRVDQLDDGSLRVVRYLSGAHEGQTQQITTRPPAVRVFSGQTFAQFWAETGSGPSCRGVNADLRMPYAGP